ncbi:hypothetical protein OG379_01200 [Streptomyces sp. NBC_01166]|uniref:hypothetical protein n=1 Tax=Streptomyces sp. NBC_01166 TaxID=2903755 RepID=UPI00386842B6|nr:hypothetical protein OG379_01200 [Streptomyces sp. NBC_01166]
MPSALTGAALKVSVLPADASGPFTALAAVYGQWMLAPGVLVALIGWPRVRLRCHTVGQVADGMLIGMVVSAPLYTLLR